MQLTPEQQSVVACRDGNFFVNAGPGAGKTASLVQRYMALIGAGFTPEQVLCITFTNKAAMEMRERVAHLMNLNMKSMHLFTFHGFCNYWLRKEGHRVGLTNYSIMSEDEVHKSIKEICKATPFKLKEYNSVSDKINFLTAENALILTRKESIVRKVLNGLDSQPGTDVALHISDKEANAMSFSAWVEFATSCLKQYSDYKRNRNKLDFGNLQPFAMHLFKNHPDIVQTYKFIMVDEAQDMNETNIRLLENINKHNNVMAIGDVLQSIYGFRGAKVTAVQDFIKRFNAKELFLTYNFRSKNNIVKFNNSSIQRPEARMTANQSDDGVLFFKEFDTQDEETNAIISKIQLLSRTTA